MDNFNKYESENYDFYRFTRLVVDALIIPNNFSIPYDMEMEIIYNAYSRFEYPANLDSPYDEQVNFIVTDKQLMLDLQSSNENF